MLASLAATNASRLLAAPAELPTSRRVTALAWDGLTHRLAVASDRRIEILLEPAWRLESSWQLEMEQVCDLALDPARERLLIAGGDPGQRGVVEMRAWPTGEMLQRWETDEDVVTCVAWAQDGSRWVEGLWSGLARIRSLEGQVLASFGGHSGPILAACWLHVPDQVATSGVDSTIKLWRAGDGSSLRSLDNHTQRVVALASLLGPTDGSPEFLVSASDDGTLRLWQPTLGRLVRFARLPSPPLAMQWLGKDLSFAVALRDQRLMHVDLRTLGVETIRESWAAPVLVAIHPPGTVLGVRDALPERIDVLP